MADPRTSKALNKLESVFWAFLIVSLLFSQISSPVLAESGARASIAARNQPETPDQLGSETGVARPAPEVSETGGRESRLGSAEEVSYETYADPVFASIVSEFADQDTYVAPTFVAGDGSAVNSVVFDDVGPCVPVLIPATESV